MEDPDPGDEIQELLMDAVELHPSLRASFLGDRCAGRPELRAEVESLIAAHESSDRFRAERQILATLNHPNIVTLLDAGVTGEGQAYLAMELVDGVPVTAYCAERRLSLRDRLRLFPDVCGGVQDAHQHGVVHRDLKPANIVVTADGVPKILDFGVATLTDTPGHQSERTATGVLRPMTPNYASPEQVRGLPVTTVSDIYSLDDGLRLELAKGYHRIGDVQGHAGDANLGDSAGALRSYRKGAAVIRPLVAGRAPPREAALELGALDLAAAAVATHSAAGSEALQAAREAQAVAKSLLQLDPADQEATTLLGNAHFHLAIALGPAESLPEWQRAGEVYALLLAKQPDDPKRQRSVALVQKYLGAYYDTPSCSRRMSAFSVWHSWRPIASRLRAPPSGAPRPL